MNTKTICTISLINGKTEDIIVEDMEWDSFVEDVFEGNGLGKYNIFRVRQKGIIEDNTIIVPKKNIISISYVEE